MAVFAPLMMPPRYYSAPRRVSSHAQDRLPSLRRLIANVAAIGGAKAEAADCRARLADFVFAQSEKSFSVPVLAEPRNEATIRPASAGEARESISGLAHQPEIAAYGDSRGGELI